MIGLARWWLNRRAAARRRQRELDAQFLWPPLWEGTRSETPRIHFERFMDQALTHVAFDLAWRREAEWIGQAEDPLEWAAAKLREEGRTDWQRMGMGRAR